MVILADDFEAADADSHWVDINLLLPSVSGERFLVSSNRAYTGTKSGHQPRIAGSSAGNDPDGGYRLFPSGAVNRRTNGGLRAEWYWYRADGDGGSQMRAGFLNPDLNGYTLACDTGDNSPLTVRLEKRVAGEVDLTMASIAYYDNVPNLGENNPSGLLHRNVWRRSVLELHASGRIDGYVYATDGTLMHQVSAVSGDVLGAGFVVGRIPIGGGTYETFDRFAAVGGVRWNIDDLSVDWINP